MEDCSRIANKAKELNLKIPYPLTFDEFINGEFYGKGINGFLVDNVDFLVQKLARNVKVEAITVTV